MKKYAILGFVNIPEHRLNNTFIGSIRIDHQSGGYPFSQPNEVVLYSRSQDVSFVMKNIHNGKITDGGPGGGKYLPVDANVFISDYFNLVKGDRHDVFHLKYQLVEYDFADPLNVVVTVLETLFAQGRTAENRETAHLAYYNVI